VRLFEPLFKIPSQQADPIYTGFRSPSSTLIAANAAARAMMNGADIKKAVTNQAKKVATTAAMAANGNGQKKRRKGDNLKPIITTDNAGSSIHDSPTQADPE
jgi:hypothetical protein